MDGRAVAGGGTCGPSPGGGRIAGPRGYARLQGRRRCAALRDELKAFETAFKTLKKALGKTQDLEVVARALTDEAVKTSVIEGVNVDESVVMSSICKALGVAYAPKGFTKDVRAEGVAQITVGGDCPHAEINARF